MSIIHGVGRCACALKTTTQKVKGKSFRSIITARLFCTFPLAGRVILLGVLMAAAASHAYQKAPKTTTTTSKSANV